MKSVYLAGFDVFRADAVEHGAYLKELCAKRWLKGIYPFDNEPPAGLESQEAVAKAICMNNIAAIRECDAVLINLNHFRGLEPDSGTAFEFGMAIALGKPVWAYFEPLGTLMDQVPNKGGVDEHGFNVEDFGLERNLMMACTWAGRSYTVQEAVVALSRHLEVGQ